MAYVSSTLSSSLAVHNQARYYAASQRASDIAESAVHQLLARLGTPAGAELLERGEAEGTIDSEDGTSVRFKLAVWSGANDGADNDQDGRSDEPDEIDLIEVRSTGYFAQVARTIRVTLIARYRDAQVGSATYVADPSSNLNFAGNSFTIQGRLHDVHGKPLEELAPAIGVPHSDSSVIDKISEQAADRITGAGGTPSVMTVPEIDINQLIGEAARSATILISDPHVSPKDGQSWGTLDAPTIVYAPRDVKISGGASGVGILVADGNLDIAGAFEWRGLIVVRGSVNLEGGGGKRLVGALILANESEDLIPGTALDVRGTVDLLFSRDAVDRVMQAFATYTILNWREGANPEEE
jgi:hypothetical protein